MMLVAPFGGFCNVGEDGSLDADAGVTGVVGRNGITASLGLTGKGFVEPVTWGMAMPGAAISGFLGSTKKVFTFTAMVVRALKIVATATPIAHIL